MKYLKDERIDFESDQSPVYLFGLAKRRVKRKLNEAANKPASNKIGDFAAAKEITDVIERIKNVRMAGSTEKIWTACNAVIMIVADNVVLHVHHADFNAPCKGIIKADGVCTGCKMSVPGEFVYSFEVLVRDVEDGSARMKLKVNDKGGKAIFGMPAHEFNELDGKGKGDLIESIQEVPVKLGLFMQYNLCKDECTPSITSFQHSDPALTGATSASQR